jgi:hypothetical protein
MTENKIKMIKVNLSALTKIYRKEGGFGKEVFRGEKR